MSNNPAKAPSDLARMFDSILIAAAPSLVLAALATRVLPHVSRNDGWLVVGLAAAVGVVAGLVVSSVLSSKGNPLRVGKELELLLFLAAAGAAASPLLLPTEIKGSGPGPEPDWVKRLDEATRKAAEKARADFTKFQAEILPRIESLRGEGKDKEAAQAAAIAALMTDLSDRFETIGQKMADLEKERGTANEARQKEIDQQLDELKEKLKEILSFQTRLADPENQKPGATPPTPPDASPSEPGPGDGKKSFLDHVGDVLKIGGDLLQAVLGIVGAILGLGGEEYQHEAKQLVTKMLNGHPVTPEDLQRVQDKLKGDEAAKARLLELIGQLDEKMKQVRPKVADLRSKESGKAIDRARKESADRIDQSATGQLRVLIDALKNKKIDLEKDPVQAVTDVIAPGKTFDSEVTKKLTDVYLRAKDPALHAKVWPMIGKYPVAKGG